MASANVENSTVSINLANGESTTVPSGETWKVKIIHSNKGGSYNRYSYVDINGHPCLGTITTDRSNYPQGQAETAEVVLTGGDTVACNIEANANSAGVQISGFKV